MTHFNPNLFDKQNCSDRKKGINLALNSRGKLLTIQALASQAGFLWLARAYTTLGWLIYFIKTHLCWQKSKGIYVFKVQMHVNWFRTGLSGSVGTSETDDFTLSRNRQGMWADCCLGIFALFSCWVRPENDDEKIVLREKLLTVMSCKVSWRGLPKIHVYEP